MTDDTHRKPALALLAATLLMGFGAPHAFAQDRLHIAQADRMVSDGVRGNATITGGLRGNNRVPGIGKVFFPGDHFTQAFPGDHFTPRQVGALNAHGITTIAQFVQADTASVARVIGADARTVGTWQRQVGERVHDR